MQHHLYWSVLPVVGGEDKVLESVKNILRPYVKEIKFELTDGESGLDDDEIKDIIHSLFEGPMYWDDFEKVPSKSRVYKILTPYIKVDLDGIFFPSADGFKFFIGGHLIFSAFLRQQSNGESAL